MSDNPQLQFTHPEFVRRWELLVGRCWMNGWDLYISSSSRSYELQTLWYGLYLQGLWGTGAPVANPDQWWGPSPWDWDARGSLHMIQADGWSHAMDVGWHGCTERDFHAIARRCGIRFPEPGENWHAQWWGLDGVYPVEEDPPTQEIDMPDYVIRSAADQYAPWLAVYPNGAIRHIGQAEAAYLGTKALTMIDETEIQSYRRALRQSGSLWPAVEAE